MGCPGGFHMVAGILGQDSGSDAPDRVRSPRSSATGNTRANRRTARRFPLPRHTSGADPPGARGLPAPVFRRA